MSIWRKIQIKIYNRIKTQKFKKRFMDILMVLSGLSSFTCLLYSNQLVNMHKESIEISDLILFIVSLIFPVLLIIFGYIFRRKWFNTNTRIVAGMLSIMVIIFSIFITIVMPGVISQQFKYDFDYVNKTSKIINFELPDDGNIETVENKYDMKSDLLVERVRDSYIEFNDTNQILDLNKRIKQSNYWTNRNTTYLKMIEANFDKYTLKESLGESKEYYYLIYNKDLKTYNEIPTKNGIYNYIMLIYNDKTGKLIISEYKLEFIK